MLVNPFPSVTFWLETMILLKLFVYLFVLVITFVVGNDWGESKLPLKQWYKQLTPNKMFSLSIQFPIAVFSIFIILTQF